jgi:BirA family biotin operon repressor/biotin-[acetyl-CoA-carboxylase] ligase
MSGPLVPTDRAIDTSAHLSARGKSGWPFVRTLVTHDVVDSTNDQAAALVRAANAELPLAVWARRQTHGRGSGSHAWWSDSGSLTFTLAIDPAAHHLAPEREPALALATAVAVIDALAELGFDTHRIGIRWPNDLEVAGRKLGGILPERVEVAGGHRILIGVGLNVLSNLLEAPDEVRAMAASLSALHPDRLDAETPQRLFLAILRRFGPVLGQLARGEPELAARWKALDLLRDEWLRVDQGGRILTGRGQGIDSDGALCLNDGRHRLRIFGGQVLRDDAPNLSALPRRD